LSGSLSKIKNYCSKREVCVSDAIKKLNTWGIDETDEIIQALIKDSFIDEKRYAFAYVNDHYKIKKWGKNKIKVGLVEKRIPKNIIELALKSINTKLYLQNLESAYKNKLKFISKSENTIIENEKLKRHLLSRGYEIELILKLIID
tara:strand:- start:1569 stop:2006 length:438 start_codon:yes stop_codon:yes gene_type:complete